MSLKNTRRKQRKNQKSRRGRRAYHKQSGGGLKEDAVAALQAAGIDATDRGLENFTFSGRFGNGKTYETGGYTFRQGSAGIHDYKLIAFKTDNPSELATLATYTD